MDITDENKVEILNLFSTLDENAKYFTDIASDILEKQIYNLDSLVETISQYINKEDKLIITEKIEEFILKLSTEIYFLGTNLENLGIKEDLAKATKQEVYNKFYISNDVEFINESGKKVKPTKDANIAFAEERSKYQTLIHNIYSRIYKILKFKIEAGNELLNSLKKILTRRIQEENLEKFQNK